MDRRQILKGLFGAAAGVTLSPLSAITLDDNVYRNSRLGFSLVKPDKWQFVSVMDFERALDQQEQRLNDPTMLKELRDLGKPILVIAKYPVEYDGYTPIVEVYAGPPDLGDFEDFESLCEAASVYGDVYHRDYVIEQQPRFVQVSGYKAAEFAARFSDEMDGRFWPSRMRSLLLHTPQFEFLFNFVGAVSGPDAAVDEFNQVRRSIDIWR